MKKTQIQIDGKNRKANPKRKTETFSEGINIYIYQISIQRRDLKTFVKSKSWI